MFNGLTVISLKPIHALALTQHSTSYLWKVWVRFGTRGLDLSYISLQCSSSKQTLTQSFVCMTQPEHRAESSNSYLTPTLAVFLFLSRFSCRSAFCLSGGLLSEKSVSTCLTLVLFKAAAFDVLLQLYSSHATADQENWRQAQICTGLLSANWHTKLCHNCKNILTHNLIIWFNLRWTDLNLDFSSFFFFSVCV